MYIHLAGASCDAGTRGPGYLLSRRIITPRKLHIHPVGAAHDLAPHGDNRLLSHRSQLPRKSYIHPAGLLYFIAHRGADYLLCYGPSSTEIQHIHPRGGCLQCSTTRGRSFTQPSLWLAVKVSYHPAGCSRCHPCAADRLLNRHLNSPYQLHIHPAGLHSAPLGPCRGGVVVPRWRAGRSAPRGVAS